ncbi:MAG TPA: Nif3-like dinuclear metal center hexameric protein, partial [Polyangiaceae bacterium]|nr:Nif3-like dinuclear metal center hexameric protein [Polyangiaceae bacterium]
GVELVVAYHPPLFRPVARLVFPSDRMEAGIHRCIRNGIAIYSPHTALDAATGGTNDVLAELCGLKSTEPLSPIPGPEGAPTVGIGRVGPLKKVVRLAQLAERLDRKLAKRCGASCISLVGNPDEKVRRAILCVGAAGSLPFEIEVGQGDVIVTGEIRHHDALRILRVGATAIALSHWTSERPTLVSLAKRLQKSLPGLAATVSRADREPFQRL